jgi:hypothetical protein
MTAEICSRFGGYPSSYIKKHTLGDLYFDHKCFLKLIESEKKQLEDLQNG